MPDFKPIPHPKDVLIEEPVIGVDQANANQDLIEPHSDNNSVFVLRRHLLADSDRLNGIQCSSTSLNPLPLDFVMREVIRAGLYRMDCLVLEVLDYRLDVLKILNNAAILGR
jgi:hypothetical protein